MCGSQKKRGFQGTLSARLKKKRLLLRNACFQILLFALRSQKLQGTPTE